jgi:hypothetical protein
LTDPPVFEFDEDIDGEILESVAKSLPGSAPAGGRAVSPKGKENQATRLVVLAQYAELYRTPDGTAYATILVNGHLENCAIRSTYFRRWLGRQYHEEAGSAPGAQAMQDASLVLEGKAIYEGPEQPVFVRVAAHGGNYYLDMGSPDWSAIEITPNGWRVIPAAEVPVKFRRPRINRPTHPIMGGSVDDLRPFLNVNRKPIGSCPSRGSGALRRPVRIRSCASWTSGDGRHDGRRLIGLQIKLSPPAIGPKNPRPRDRGE